MKYNKSQIMKRAWAIRKMSLTWVSSLTFSQCLSRAWEEAKKNARKFSGIVRNVQVAGTICHPVNVDIDLDNLIVTGNTYPVREMLKGIGLTWDRYNKGWTGSYDVLNAMCVKYA